MINLISRQCCSYLSWEREKKAIHTSYPTELDDLLKDRGSEPEEWAFLCTHRASLQTNTLHQTMVHGAGEAQFYIFRRQSKDRVLIVRIYRNPKREVSVFVKCFHIWKKKKKTHATDKELKYGGQWEIFGNKSITQMKFSLSLLVNEKSPSHMAADTPCAGLRECTAVMHHKHSLFLLPECTCGVCTHTCMSAL